MGFSDMRLLAPDIGLVGMELLRSNFALEDFSTMKILMLAIGLKMFPGAKNIVRFVYSPFWALTHMQV